MNLVALGQMDIGELGGAPGAECLGEQPEAGLAAAAHGDPRRHAPVAAEQAPGPDLGMVHQQARAQLRRLDPQRPHAAESTALLASAAGIRPQPVGHHGHREARLEHLNRGDAAIADDMVLAVVAVALGPAAPSARLEMVVGIVVAGLWMDAADQEVAGGAALAGADPLGDHRRQRAQH